MYLVTGAVTYVDVLSSEHYCVHSCPCRPYPSWLWHSVPRAPCQAPLGVEKAADDLPISPAAAEKGVGDDMAAARQQVSSWAGRWKRTVL